MKIPKNAKKVFEGVIFDVYQWEQEMFDGTFETFEMLSRVNTIQIIATAGDKILLAHQSQPTKEDFYSLFGGRAEKGEQPLETAKRELLEESGLRSSDWELLKIYNPMHKIDWEVYLFVARNCKKVAEQKLDTGEKIETIECAFDKFLEIAESDKFWGEEFITDVLRMKQDKKKMEDFKNKLFP